MASKSICTIIALFRKGVFITHNLITLKLILKALLDV